MRLKISLLVKLNAFGARGFLKTNFNGIVTCISQKTKCIEEDRDDILVTLLSFIVD